MTFVYPKKTKFEKLRDFAAHAIPTANLLRLLNICKRNYAATIYAYS